MLWLVALPPAGFGTFATEPAAQAERLFRTSYSGGIDGGDDYIKKNDDEMDYDIINNKYDSSEPCIDYDGWEAADHTERNDGYTSGVGILAIEVHLPYLCADAFDLERHAGEPGSLTRRCLMQQYSVCSPQEDVLSMAQTALWRLMRRHHVAAADVGMLQVASPAILDRSKTLKTELLGVIEALGAADVEGVDNVCGV